MLVIILIQLDEPEVFWVFFACFRYRGHKMKGYKLDCCFSSKDDHVLSCSEDGFVYCWDLVEVSIHQGSSTLHVYLHFIDHLSLCNHSVL